jgi:hypothetical protein
MVCEESRWLSFVEERRFGRIRDGWEERRWLKKRRDIREKRRDVREESRWLSFGEERIWLGRIRDGWEERSLKKGRDIREKRRWLGRVRDGWEERRWLGKVRDGWEEWRWLGRKRDGWEESTDNNLVERRGDDWGGEEMIWRKDGCRGEEMARKEKR